MGDIFDSIYRQERKNAKRRKKQDAKTAKYFEKLIKKSWKKNGLS